MKAIFRDGSAAIDLIITSSRWLAEIMTELEELIPRACSPLKRVRNVAVELVSNALINDRPKGLRSRTSVLSQESFESNGFLILMKLKRITWAPEIRCMTSHSSIYPVSVLECLKRRKRHCPKEFLLLIHIPISNTAMFLGRKQHIRSSTFNDNRKIPNVQTLINTDKGKDVLVEAPKRHRTRLAQSIISAL
ncbi:LOW QUALITY PROTEIN: hypothetical protein Cgig2_011635 [Carnegiea gigantea]|uniref:Uncharacterized protein n=1 Tax=Carnegiea gigantea TaxID=171969 RepID=A0A9Q1KFQ4_9CARY|nr:LOW QUALITY PROTEIN: hypothetical protein Cgig2_011635 [Carnegiea gigantea]